jgi:membrane-bound lytic murein transglycosylase A
MNLRLALSAVFFIFSLIGCQSAIRSTAQTCHCPTQVPLSKPIYTPTPWEQLPGWKENAIQPGFLAWRNGCSVLKTQALWRDVCQQAQQVPSDEAAIRQFVESQFIPLQVSLSNGETTGLVTGYYEPLLQGDIRPSAKARYPIYAPPADLITIELASLYPDLKHRRLRGRLNGNKVIPYYDRTDIERQKGKMQAIAWVDDAIELFFLQVQGSGRIQLPNGSYIRVGYADQNGHPYRSIGKWLIDQGELTASQVSMQSIKAWARKHVNKAQALLNVNPSFVFFKKLEQATGGPFGALGIPLTEGYSVAVDRNFTPLGAPLYLSTQYPNETRPLARLVAAQDTGGAIRGPMRVDFFWGFGAKAGDLAGKMKQSSSVWILWPKASPLPSKT